MSCWCFAGDFASEPILSPFWTLSGVLTPSTMDETPKPYYSCANQPMAIVHRAQGLVGRAIAQCGEGSPDQWYPSNGLSVEKCKKKLEREQKRGPCQGWGRH